MATSILSGPMEGEVSPTTTVLQVNTVSAGPTVDLSPLARVGLPEAPGKSSKPPFLVVEC